MDSTVLTDLPRGDPDRSPEQFIGPAAAFAPPSAVIESKKLRQDHGKMFLGLAESPMSSPDNHLGAERYANHGFPIGIADNRHMVTVAGTRAGKGRAAIIPNMLLYPGSVLATDPKGELATITARKRHGMGQNVHVLDPFGLTKGFPVTADLRCGFNPIVAMRQDSLLEDAALIADALVVVQGHDPHWEESAKSFIEGVILHVKTAPKFGGNGTLVDVRNLVGRGDTDEEETSGYSMAALIAAMETNPSCNGAVQMAATDYADKPDRERGSVLSTARRCLKFLAYPGIQDVVSRHDFDLADLKRKPTTIYLCLPAGQMGSCAPWLRLFVNLTLRAMERELAPPAGNFPVLFCLDEFASLGKMRQIEDAAGQIAGFGVKLWPILQDLGQLKTLYGDRWETFFGNAGVLQFFGNNDITTLEWISKRLGNTTIRTQTDIPYPVQGQQGSGGQNWTNETHPLLGVEEVATVFGRDDKLLRQLVILAGYPPIVLQRAFYDKHQIFTGMFDEIPK